MMQFGDPDPWLRVANPPEAAVRRMTSPTPAGPRSFWLRLAQQQGAYGRARTGVAGLKHVSSGHLHSCLMLRVYVSGSKGAPASWCCCCGC